MITAIRHLFTLQVSHGYPDSQSTGVEFVLPASAFAILRRGRMLQRNGDVAIRVLVETGADGGPLVPLAETWLRIGLRPRVPTAFGNVTAALHAGSETPVFRSTGAPDALGPPADLRVVGSLPHHVLTRSLRPATVSVADAANGPVWSQVVADATAEVTVDLRGQPPGRYRLRCVDAAGSVEQELLLEPELADCFAVVEIRMDAALRARESVFTLALPARLETLRYYVVAKGGAAALAGVTVEDAGSTDDGRPPVSFVRIEPTAFQPFHLPAGALAAEGAVVLLESTVPVPRMHPGRRRIQLSRNGEVLIPSLPAAEPERPASDLIIHLPRP